MDSVLCLFSSKDFRPGSLLRVKRRPKALTTVGVLGIGARGVKLITRAETVRTSFLDANLPLVEFCGRRSGEAASPCKVLTRSLIAPPARPPGPLSVLNPNKDVSARVLEMPSVANVCTDCVRPFQSSTRLDRRRTLRRLGAEGAWVVPSADVSSASPSTPIASPSIILSDGCSVANTPTKALEKPVLAILVFTTVSDERFSELASSSDWSIG
mmetsp:Transcript_36533/g.70104  ORF Transcript_36533/g.70104 Transcript_36533/m.70104 type:complete len:213 (-) Transcript_36533:686-1324(-)